MEHMCGSIKPVDKENQLLTAVNQIAQEIYLELTASFDFKYYKLTSELMHVTRKSHLRHIQRPSSVIGVNIQNVGSG